MSNPVYITANSVDISNSIDWPSVDFVSVLTKEVSTLKFSIRKGSGQTLPAKTIPTVGDIIEMFDPSGMVFGGTVTEVETVIEGLLLTWQITCTDWSYLFDGVLVKKNYALMDPHDIVVDLVATFCAGKGFTTNHVQVGNFVVPSIKFNYMQPTKCLESLAKLIGWDWYIDPNKDIHFFLGDVEDAIGEGGVAPITIDGTSGQIEWNSLDVDQNLQNMKNSVFVIGGSYPKLFSQANTPDVYPTTAGQVVYAIGYPYNNSTIVVTLDGVTKTVGIDQQTDPSTVQVLYNDKNRFVKFTSDPGGAHTVKVSGQALIPIVAHASDADSIATYGEYQDVIVDKKISTVPEAQARAQAAILQFGHPVYDVKVKTLTPGCAIGQAITVNLPAFGITNKQLVIKRVEATVFAPGANAQLEYQLECIGSDNVTFVDIMTTLLQQEASQNPVDDSTVNENLTLAPAESLTLADTLIATAIAKKTFRWDPSEVMDYNESNFSFSNNMDGTGIVLFAEAFKNLLAGTLDSAWLYLNKAGTPTGTFVAKIYACTGTPGTNGVPTGSALATSDAVSVSGLGTSPAIVKLNFSGGNRITLSANTNYCIVLDGSGISGDASNKLQYGVGAFKPQAGVNGAEFLSGSWISVSSEDLISHVLLTDQNKWGFAVWN